MNPKWIFLLCSLVLVVTFLTCHGKKISILSNRPNRNTISVLMSSPLTTLHESPANSEVIKPLIIQPSLIWVLEVLCHPVREHSGLFRILLPPGETDLFIGRPNYEQFPQLLWKLNLHGWRWPLTLTLSSNLAISLVRMSECPFSPRRLEESSPCSPWPHMAPGWW